MALLKRVFRQQSARVSALNRRPSVITTAETDAEEEDEKFLIPVRDDTALILSPPPVKPTRRVPVHSNSAICVFNGRKCSITRGYVHPQFNNAKNFKGFLTRSTSTVGQFRCVTITARSATVRHDKSCARTCTVNDLSILTRSAGGYRLSAQQRSLIKQCWNEANKRQSVGLFVLRWLFKREPRFKMVFDVANVPSDQLEKSRMFQKEVESFSNVLEMVVDSVTAEQDTHCLLDDVMGPFLCSYGSEKAATEETAPFRSADWELLATAMREFVGESCRSNGLRMAFGSPFQKRNEAIHAWNVLVHFVVAKVKRGYELEKERIKPKSR